MSTTTFDGLSSACVRAAIDPTVREPVMNMVKAILAAVCRRAVALCADTHRQPSRVRVAAGDVVVELYWPEAGSGAGRTDEQGAAVPAQWFPAPPAASGASVPQNGATAVAADEGETITHIVSPSVGVFYRAPEPGAKAFVNEGDMVVAGQQVGIIEVMKLMIPVEADRPGRIVEVLHPDLTGVEFGVPLFSVLAVGVTI